MLINRLFAWLQYKISIKLLTSNNSVKEERTEEIMKKKVLAMLMALTMTMAMPCMAYATGAETPAAGEAASNEETKETKAPESFNMSFVEKGSISHNYKVYQIFSGTYFKGDDGKVVLSDIEWGKSVNNKSFTLDGTEYTDAKKLAEALSSKTDAELEAIRADLKKLVDGGEAAGEFNSDPEKAVNVTLPAGYYLIEDVTSEENLKNDTRSSYVIQLVDNIEVKAKSGTVTSEKKVDDVNDSTGVKEELQDTADYDIGDSVPFTITGKIPNNYDKYNTFYYAFHDTMEKGLVYNEDAKVYADGVEISADEIKVSDDKLSFDVIFNDLKKLPNINKDTKKIELKYTCTLTEDCVVGKHGNLNKSYLEYSNNPNSDSKGTTPEDSNIVFTYKVVVNKTDEDKKPISGAEFKIEKLVNGTYVETGLKVSQDGTQFSVTGIDDGVYRLTETKAPDGYNKLSEPYYFVVSSEHDFAGFIDDSNREDIIKKFTASQVSGDDTSLKLEGENIEIEFTATLDDGTVSTNVVNSKGSTLPSTGGIGTTIFYVLGGVLIVGAGVALFVRKRMDEE